jgi:L-amino acid N-acyltransferase YncA
VNVRPASFRDLGRIEQLYREAIEREQSGWSHLSADSPVPQTTLVRLWHAVSKTLSSLVPLTDSSSTEYLFVVEEEGRVVGFVQAQGASGNRRAWQIINLCIGTGGRSRFAGERLLNQLCDTAVEQGITRLCVRVPMDHPLVGLFLEQGFTQYATEQILYRESAEGAAPAAGVPLRVARRDDRGAIYQLYLRTTPSHVANLEGPSQKMWLDAFQQGWVARLGRDDVEHFVAETPGVTGWVAIRPQSGARPALMALMCDGHDPAHRDEVVDAALALGGAGPVTCVLRHYDSELIRALQSRGFEIFGTQLLLVRDLAIKLKVRSTAARKKPVLVHAGLARSLEMTPPIRVLTRFEERSSTSSLR